MPHNILVATPTYGRVSSEPIGTLLKLQSYLIGAGHGVGTLQHTMAEIARSRNIMATVFHENPAFTHLLFVDSDMVFEPRVVQRLIDADKPVVGLIYPKRKIDLDALIAAARVHTRREHVIASALEYTAYPLEGRFQVEEGLAAVRAIGMGLTLIKREVFDRLAPNVTRDHAAGVGRTKGPVLGFFDHVQVESGFLGEDMSFCERWRRAGGEVWALIDEEIGHLGEMVFKGRFIDALEARAASQSR